MEPAAIFTDILREEREKRGISSTDLAESLGLHPHIIAKWECGSRFPRLNTAMRWAQALGVALELRANS